MQSLPITQKYHLLLPVKQSKIFANLLTNTYVPQEIHQFYSSIDGDEDEDVTSETEESDKIDKLLIMYDFSLL